MMPLEMMPLKMMPLKMKPLEMMPLKIGSPKKSESCAGDIRARDSDFLL